MFYPSKISYYHICAHLRNLRQYYFASDMMQESATTELQRRAMLRYVRPIATALCIFVCIGLIALWWRSYYTRVTLRGPFSTTKQFWIESVQGQVSFSAPWRGAGQLQWKVQLKSHEIHRESMMFQEPFSWKSLYFSFGEEYPVRFVIVPYWFFILAAGTLGSAIWFRWRFSLRSLMIGTALLALVLVWVMSHF